MAVIIKKELLPKDIPASSIKFAGHSINVNVEPPLLDLESKIIELESRIKALEEAYIELLILGKDNSTT